MFVPVEEPCKDADADAENEDVFEEVIVGLLVSVVADDVIALSDIAAVVVVAVVDGVVVVVVVVSALDGCREGDRLGG